LGEIQQRDASLQASEQRFRTLADTIPQLAWMSDAEGATLWFNQRWYDYTGTNPEQQTGWGWQSSIDPRSLPEVLSQWSNSLRTGKRFEMVYALRARDGSFRDFLAIALPVRSPEGVVEHWFGTNTDITRQRQAEEALRRSEKLAATGRLAASVAHEINNPLAAVTNLLYLACTHPDKAALYASRAATEVDRIAEITKTTLGFYRDTSVPSYVDLADVIRSVLALFQRKLQARGLTVTQRLAPGAVIIGWSGEIRQIFTNLIANAIEACSDHATLAIKVSSAHGWANSDGAGVLVSILDHGCGIAASALPKIFEPFYTTKQDVGTGLGLWLTQNLVKKHGGSIRVRSWTSPTQRGTVFSVFLPAAKARHQEAN
ncbi:MAG: two-component system sensor histidine kinase NtrB, partial [Terriglobales bacterium]